jgi:hypothetical protein
MDIKKLIAVAIPKTTIGKAVAGSTAAIVAIPIFPVEDIDINAKKRYQNRLEKIESMVKDYGVYAGTGNKRLTIPKKKLSEETINDLGFKKSLIAIPEAGQDKFYSYRHPKINFHIHSHGDDWTIHEDEHMSGQMIALSRPSIIGKALATIQGFPHLFTEGMPGLGIYIGGKIGGVKSTSDKVRSEQLSKITRRLERWKDDMNYYNEEKE